jgi:hypothetical protein
MANTTFSGPVTSNAGFNSDDTLTSADYTNGGFNLTNFTVRPAATYANTVAALVGAVNQRTAGVQGGNIFGVYAQTSFSDNPTSTLTGLNTAVYGVVDCGSSNKSFSKRRNSLHSIVFDFYLRWTKKQLRSVLQL